MGLWNAIGPYVQPLHLTSHHRNPSFSLLFCVSHFLSSSPLPPLAPQQLNFYLKCFTTFSFLFFLRSPLPSWSFASATKALIYGERENECAHNGSVERISHKIYGASSMMIPIRNEKDFFSCFYSCKRSLLMWWEMRLEASSTSEANALSELYIIEGRKASWTYDEACREFKAPNLQSTHISKSFEIWKNSIYKLEFFSFLISFMCFYAARF